MEDADLLTAEQVADRLGISESVLAAWRRGVGPGASLPFVRVGVQIRYRSLDVDNWLESRTTTGVD